MRTSDESPSWFQFVLSRVRLITTLKFPVRTSSTIMLAADRYLDFFADSALLPKQELLEAHHGKISLHHAKAGYDYPAIRLPFTFSKLAGLRTRIYQTVHDGALAFLVVVSSADKAAGEITKKSENAIKGAKSLRFDMAGVAVPNPAEIIVLFSV